MAGTPVVRETRAVAGPVYKYLKDHPDTIVFVGDIVTDLGIPSSSISAALGKMTADPSMRITKGQMRGQYIYHSGHNAPVIPQADNPHGAVIHDNGLVPFPKQESAKAKIVRELDEKGVSTYPAPERREFEFVGKVGEFQVIRDNADELHVAIPLREFVTFTS